MFSFIYIARVGLRDGTSTTVVTNDEDDVVASDRNGNTILSDDKNITILPFWVIFFQFDVKKQEYTKETADLSAIDLRVSRNQLCTKTLPSFILSRFIFLNLDTHDKERVIFKCVAQANK